MKTRAYHHGDLRATLLSLAEETLRDRGPAELSLRELAREAGVSPAAPSRHFKTKQALLDALALEGFDRLLTALAEALRAGGDSFAGQVDALARTYVTFAVSHAALLELMYGFKHQPGASDGLVAAAQRLTAMANGLIEDGQRRGEVRAGPVDRLAMPLAAALQGFATLALSGGFTPEETEEALTEMVTFVQRGLR